MAIIQPPSTTGEELQYDCSSSVVFGKLVYIDSNNNVNLADNTNINTTPCIGMVISKPTTLSCIVKTNGEIEGLSGITPGQRYFLGTEGDITSTPPTESGSIIQVIGIGTKSDSLLLLLDYSIILL